MGCQCAKSNFPTERNEILKESSSSQTNRNVSSVNKNKQLTASNSNQQFLESLKKEGSQFEDDATSNNNKRSVNSPLLTIYNERIIELLNKIRSNPSEYAKTVEESMSNIQRNNDNKLIYKSKVKVTLAQGKPAFQDAIEKLRMIHKMEPLAFKPEIVVPLPETKEQLKDINFFKEKVKEVQKRANIDIYFRDLVKNPETSALLMIVDDIERNPGKKRNAILNPLYKYIGVSSIFIDHTFMAYFSFSK